MEPIYAMSDTPTSQNPESDYNFAPPPPPSNTDYRHARWSRPLHAQASPGAAAQPRPTITLSDQRQVVIVGVCSSGKSTLSRALKERGVSVRTCAQEHSYIPNLWQLRKPDVLVYLDASLHTIRRRRRPSWQQPVLDEQHRRLSHAREHCHIYVHTDGLSPQDVTSRVLTYLNNHKQPADDTHSV